MGYLEELKRQAEATRAQNAPDVGALQRNTQLTEAACQSAFRYLAMLAQQLDVLQPPARSEYRLDSNTAFRNLRRTGFRADSRLRRLRDAEVLDFVSLAFIMKSGSRITLAKDFPPSIDKLEARLAQCGANYDSEIVRDPLTGRFVEKRYQIAADFQGSIRLVPDHDSGWIQFQIANLDGFETVTVQFPAFEVGPARLDDLARWIVGDSHDFLKDGHQLRRVEA